MILHRGHENTRVRQARDIRLEPVRHTGGRRWPARLNPAIDDRLLVDLDGRRLDVKVAVVRAAGIGDLHHRVAVMVFWPASGDGTITAGVSEILLDSCQASPPSWSACHPHAGSLSGFTVGVNRQFRGVTTSVAVALHAAPAGEAAVTVAVYLWLPSTRLTSVNRFTPERDYRPVHR